MKRGLRVDERITIRGSSLSHGVGQTLTWDERDSGSALTFFLVRKGTDGGTADNGAIDAKERVSLVADSRSASTMAYEAGQFLGALTAEGKYDSEDFGGEHPSDLNIRIPCSQSRVRRRGHLELESGSGLPLRY
jgi:hypothetical protein